MSIVVETSYFEHDWQKSFWGSNYPRLRQIKKHADGFEKLSAKERHPTVQDDVECRLSVRVSDAGRARMVDPGVGGRHRKASDEGTRGKAVSAWPTMGI